MSPDSVPSVSSEAKALCAEGVRRMATGELEEAEARFREALRLVPESAEAFGNLGLLLDRKGTVAEADECYRRSVALSPDCLQAHLNYGAFLLRCKRFAEAEDVFQTGIRLAPHSPAAWSNLGVLLVNLKRYRDAEQCYRTALGLEESYAKARYNLSYLLLRRGDYGEGWHYMKAREWSVDCSPHLSCPPWQGEPLMGKSILIGVEGGHGDMIQFCRYATVLKARGARCVTLMCHPALKVLFATVPGVDRVIALGETLPATGWDFWTLPFSLPFHCQTRLDTIPAAIPYLSPPSERLVRWRTELPHAGVRVGLVWKGNPSFENDAERSLPSLETLAPLGRVAGACFISLQKGAGEQEAVQPPAGLAVIDLGSRLEDFADSAAIVANLDLVICVDTAMAHLAGALGKPCWVLLSDALPDWRWLDDRCDSPWYPGAMRLFRQTGGERWPGVVAKVAAALEQFVAETYR